MSFVHVSLYLEEKDHQPIIFFNALDSSHVNATVSAHLQIKYGLRDWGGKRGRLPDAGVDFRNLVDVLFPAREIQLRDPISVLKQVQKRAGVCKRSTKIAVQKNVESLPSVLSLDGRFAFFRLVEETRTRHPKTHRQNPRDKSMQ